MKPASRTKHEVPREHGFPTAVEASYTGDLHNADRARNHAALMQRLTNKPCRAVIASARNNDRLLELIDSGEVAWHQLQVRIQPAN